ncbi:MULTISPECIES: DMT family transporter [unclassified Polaromonas]|uniref:DMT family transporter n=1 Tax=unclassified Polaromonas TaxID=2638319 RepID=UPI000BCCF4CF|nr:MULTISPECIES: DMT family transporter [unclassified Polaromonas]OYY37939.1 MAG: EamA family transporter [Polaromonas sp. 35-63-35]OYZ21120.1 MAG: EamA family transporter [Polaromonas sp. 16-63-31]OYZ79486.1 MAG: EamA family transporter [Polaromonas sp. 24-63-21]OZA50632.1 MAG: EamA family transporter [Polaromonas sp. 17-63-33]OZA89491.1 MAG: EamA family transporter [Polaromonas sp. 39-63-25]
MSSTSASASASAGARPKHWAIDFVLLAAIWGSSFLFMRIGTVEFGPLPTAAVRVAIAAAFLLPLVLLRGLGTTLVKNWRHVFLIGMFNSGIPFACFSFALLSITTGLSAILNATVPMFGALVAWLWLKDKPNHSRLLGLVVGFAGVAMLAWDKATFKPDASGVAPGWAVLACLFACICYALSASYTKRYLTGLPPLVTAAGSQIGATLGLALPALWLWPAKMPGSSAWLALLVVGVLCTGIAYILYFRLIASAGPARALAVTFVVPVFAVFYGVLFLGEAVTLWMLLCAVVIVCGTALSTGLLKIGR